MPEVHAAPAGMFCPFMSGESLKVQTSPLARADGAMAAPRAGSALVPCIRDKCLFWHRERAACKLDLAAEAQIVTAQLTHQGFAELLSAMIGIAEAFGVRAAPPREADGGEEGTAAERAAAESREPSIIVAGPEDVPPTRTSRRG